MRSFIALPIPPIIRKDLYDEMAFLRSKNLKKVEEENLHFTLFFLGESIREKDKDKFCDLILSLNFPSFEISIGKAGAFYDENSLPKTLWLGIKKGKEEISKLRFILLEKMKIFGLDFNEKFSPHLTVARTKGSMDSSLLKHFLGLDFSEKFFFKVEKFVWLESRLSYKGPKYFTLAEKRLI